MGRPNRWVRVAALCAVLASLPPTAFAYTGEELAPRAQVSIAQARSIALHTVPGEITDEELETEDRGSGLRYTFNIKHGAETHEIGIDAKTGAVLENSIEGQEQR
jgi:uncharacterized membrane protein YkoI